MAFEFTPSSPAKQYGTEDLGDELFNTPAPPAQQDGMEDPGERVFAVPVKKRESRE
jgi:hypothetical protein